MTITIRLLITVEPRIFHGRADWNVQVAGYLYTFESLPGSEVLAFHWHPNEPRSIHFPHIHIGSAMIAADAPIRHDSFHRAHIPTGQIFIEDVVRFAIAELGVTPLRSDWDAVLAGIARQRTQVP